MRCRYFESQSSVRRRPNRDGWGIMSVLTNTRSAPRLRNLKRGSITFGAGAAIDCIIRNLSETGAGLAVESPVGVPEQFVLIIKPEPVKRNCQIAWRSAKRIGVRFT
jgi:hypothetical protein